MAYKSIKLKESNGLQFEVAVISPKSPPLYSTKNWKVRVIIKFLTLSKMFEGKWSLCPLLSILQSQFLMLPTYFCYLLRQYYSNSRVQDKVLLAKRAMATGPACLQSWTQRTLPTCQLETHEYNIGLCWWQLLFSFGNSIPGTVPDCMRQTGWGATRLN